jgi:hypothetical protein
MKPRTLRLIIAQSTVVRVMLLAQMARGIPAAKELALRKARVPQGSRSGASGASVGVPVVTPDDKT